jgi:hypothetical protein
MFCDTIPVPAMSITQLCSKGLLSDHNSSTQLPAIPYDPGLDDYGRPVQDVQVQAEFLDLPAPVSINLYFHLAYGFN